MWKLLLLTLPLSLPFVSAPAAQDGDEITKLYRECAETEDRDALVTLWKENPHVILYTIDADLEGSLKLVESSETPDMDAVAALHKRALFGAACADMATDSPIFVEYATSFIGWTPEQQKTFRAGQKAYGAARAAMKDGDMDAAAKHGAECAELAEPLGDWWGTAMGFSAQGAALHNAGKHDDAVVPLTRARMIYHDLGLVRAEYSVLKNLAATLVALDRKPRARGAIRQAMGLSRLLGDEEGGKALRELAGSMKE